MLHWASIAAVDSPLALVAGVLPDRGDRRRRRADPRPRLRAEQHRAADRVVRDDELGAGEAAIGIGRIDGVGAVHQPGDEADDPAARQGDERRRDVGAVAVDLQARRRWKPGTFTSTSAEPPLIRSARFDNVVMSCRWSAASPGRRCRRRRRARRKRGRPPGRPAKSAAGSDSLRLPAVLRRVLCEERQRSERPFAQPASGSPARLSIGASPSAARTPLARTQIFTWDSPSFATRRKPRRRPASVGRPRAAARRISSASSCLASCPSSS